MKTQELDQALPTQDQAPATETTMGGGRTKNI